MIVLIYVFILFKVVVNFIIIVLVHVNVLSCEYGDQYYTFQCFIVTTM